MIQKIKNLSLKKIMIGLGIFVFFVLIVVAQNMIGAQAHIISVSLSPNVMVSPPEIKFGNVFPEEQLQSSFNVSLAQDCKEKKDHATVNYSVVQKIKPKHGATPPNGYPGTISEYCQTHKDDQTRCYLNLCPFLIKVPDSPNDSEATSTLGGNDKADKWTINFLVPDIFGSVGQENEGGVISQSGDYGCDISIEIKEQPKVYKISGKKFQDKDGDGKFDHGEEGLSGWTIYLDSNDNGKLDAGETSDLTDEDGDYSFNNLPVGVYHVREVLKSGWKQTLPAAGKYDINLTSDVAGKDFGNQKLCKISGHEFEDKNGNGKQDRGEGALAGWTIQLKKPDGSTITAKTDKDGDYEFDDLECGGRYSVKEIQPSGWKQTTKDWGDFAPSSGDNKSSNDFGNRRK